MSHGISAVLSREYLQTKAVSSFRKSISSLLDVRPEHANLPENGQSREVDKEKLSDYREISWNAVSVLANDCRIMAGK